MKTKYIVLGVCGVALLGLLYYGISPLFNNVVVHDELPEGMEEITTDSGDSDAPPSIVRLGENGSEIVDTPTHPASGEVRVVYGDDGRRILRYENYKTINGPDIYVYLATDENAKDFISLGKVRGTEGNINYEIPKEIDLHKYKYALTWCKAFGVLFNSALLQ